MTNNIKEVFEKCRLEEGYVLDDGSISNENYELTEKWFHLGYSAGKDVSSQTNNQEEFEHAVYKRYFISQITRLTLDYNTKTLTELCAKDDAGEYIDKDISAMWFGYNIRGI